MSTLQYVRHEKISLKGHPEFSEAWLRDRIVEDVSILGLDGKLKVVGIEKAQFQGGRLDLLLKDEDEDLLYEVELMLGKTDESHIIRTVEYWDSESKRFRDFDHCAVVVAEEITNRFFNVINLFNRFVPLIALQLNALRVIQTNELSLHFSKVLDLSDREEIEIRGGGIVAPPIHDRKYWEEKVFPGKLDAVDTCASILKKVEPGVELTYKKNFIGLKLGEQPNNFVYFNPKQRFTRVAVRIQDTTTWGEKLNGAGLNAWKSDDRVKFRLTLAEAQRTQDLLTELFQASYKEWQA